MKLSELVSYLNQLNRLHVNEARTKTDFDINAVKHLINSKTFDPTSIVQQLDNTHQQIQKDFDVFVGLIEQAKQEAIQEIGLREQFWLDETFKLYNEAMVNDSDEHILNRRPSITPEHDTIIRARIRNFSNNLHPGMINPICIHQCYFLLIFPLFFF